MQKRVRKIDKLKIWRRNIKNKCKKIGKWFKIKNKKVQIIKWKINKKTKNKN